MIFETSPLAARLRATQPLFFVSPTVGQQLVLKFRRGHPELSTLDGYSWKPMILRGNTSQYQLLPNTWRYRNTKQSDCVALNLAARGLVSNIIEQPTYACEKDCLAWKKEFHLFAFACTSVSFTNKKEAEMIGQLIFISYFRKLSECVDYMVRSSRAFSENRLSDPYYSSMSCSGLSFMPMALRVSRSITPVRESSPLRSKNPFIN